MKDVNINTWLLVVILLVTIFGFRGLENELLIWLDDIEQRVKSIETHLMKTDQSYVQTK